MNWAIAILLFFCVSARSEDHSTPVVAPPAPSPNTVINVAPPDATPEELELVGTIRAEVTADPQWVEKTVEDIQQRFGEQAPETLQALESALNNLAAGEQPADGFAGDLARELVEEGANVESRILGRAPSRFAKAPNPPTVALPPVRPLPNNTTKILQKTDELSYKSPRVLPASAPRSVFANTSFSAFAENDGAVEGAVASPENPGRKVRVDGLYKNGGTLADAVTAPAASNGGVTVSTGGGVLNLVPTSKPGPGSVKKQLAGALFRAMRNGKGVVSGELRPHLASSRPTPLLKEGAMEQLQDLFHAPTTKKVVRAARTIAQVAARPPQLNKKQLWIYYGAMAGASIATLAYLLFLAQRLSGMPVWGAQKSAESATDEDQAA